MRRVTDQERNFLERYFGPALDTDAVSIGVSIGSRSWSPYGGRISLVARCFVDARAENPIRLDNPWIASVFAHEAIHVWQRQRGRRVTREGAVLQSLYTLGLFDPYAYDQSVSHPKALLATFVLGNIEQQGRIFEDYVRNERSGRDIRLFAEVAAWVRLSTSK